MLQDIMEQCIHRRKKMATSNIHATFKCDIKKVWNIITSLKDYS